MRGIHGYHTALAALSRAPAVTHASPTRLGFPDGASWEREGWGRPNLGTLAGLLEGHGATLTREAGWVWVDLPACPPKPPRRRPPQPAPGQNERPGNPDANLREPDDQPGEPDALQPAKPISRPVLAGARADALKQARNSPPTPNLAAAPTPAGRAFASAIPDQAQTDPATLKMLGRLLLAFEGSHCPRPNYAFATWVIANCGSDLADAALCEAVLAWERKIQKVGLAQAHRNYFLTCIQRHGLPPKVAFKNAPKVNHQDPGPKPLQEAPQATPHEAAPQAVSVAKMQSAEPPRQSEAPSKNRTQAPKAPPAAPEPPPVRPDEIPVEAWEAATNIFRRAGWKRDLQLHTDEAAALLAHRWPKHLHLLAQGVAIWGRERHLEEGPRVAGVKGFVQGVSRRVANLAQAEEARAQAEAPKTPGAVYRMGSFNPSDRRAPGGPEHLAIEAQIFEAVGFKPSPMEATPGATRYPAPPKLPQGINDASGIYRIIGPMIHDAAFGTDGRRLVVSYFADKKDHIDAYIRHYGGEAEVAHALCRAMGIQPASLERIEVTRGGAGVPQPVPLPMTGTVTRLRQAHDTPWRAHDRTMTGDDMERVGRDLSMPKTVTDPCLKP